MNPTISRELQRQHQAQLLREAELDRLVRASSGRVSGFGQHLALPLARVLVSLGNRLQRRYAGERAGSGLALAAGARPPATADEWMALLAREVRPERMFMLIHVTDSGTSGFTCWGELAAPDSLGPLGSLGPAGLRFAQQHQP